MNTEKQPGVFRIDLNYCFEQSGYWASYCTISSFTVVYLSYRGLTNTAIGATTSIASVLAILLQLFVSNYSDKHPEFPIKKILAALFLITISGAAINALIPLPIAMMIAVYAVMSGADQSNNGYLNAQMMQFNNVGIPAHYGWPRGVGSMCYAIAAFAYGQIVDRYSPKVLMPILIVGSAVTLLFVLLMPNPYKGREELLASAKKESGHHVTYREMLTQNRLLAILLVCIMVNQLGNTSLYTYAFRVVQKVGAGTSEYGISEFIRASTELPMLIASAYFLKKFKAGRMVQVSFFGNALRAFIMAAAWTMPMVYMSSLTNFLCAGLYNFSCVVYVNSIVGPGEKVRAQSLVMLTGSIGSILGNLGGGWMIDHVGLSPLLIICGFFCVAAACMMNLSFARQSEM